VIKREDNLLSMLKRRGTDRSLAQGWDHVRNPSTKGLRLQEIGKRARRPNEEEKDAKGEDLKKWREKVEVKKLPVGSRSEAAG